MAENGGGAGRMTVDDFDELFEEIKTWGRWGPDDERGTLNYLTPDKVAAAAATVQSRRTVTLSLPVNTVAGPDTISIRTPWANTVAVPLSLAVTLLSA